MGRAAADIAGGASLHFFPEVRRGFRIGRTFV